MKTRVRSLVAAKQPAESEAPKGLVIVPVGSRAGAVPVVVKLGVKGETRVDVRDGGW